MFNRGGSMQYGFEWACKSKKRAKPRQEEHKLQCDIVNYLFLMEGSRKDFYFFSVPNGGWRNPTVASKLKAEGVRSGVSDLVLLHKGKAYFVEIKTDKGRQSETQVYFEDIVKKLGFEYLIWRSLDDAMFFMQELKKSC